MCFGSFILKLVLAFIRALEIGLSHSPKYHKAEFTRK